VSNVDTYQATETVFADDASLYQRSLKSMQCFVDARMLFVDSQVCTATSGNVGGWQLLALTPEMGGCMERSGLPVVDGRGVKAGPLVAFEKVDLDEVWRYLGMIQDGDGNCEHMVEQLRLQVGEAAEVLSRKKISLAGAIYLSNVQGQGRG
jgi:hypothetical protein